METFRTYCSIDAYGRLNVLSSTQIVFHCRRILANALHVPKSMIRVAKPRIGGGFGAKQKSVCEVYPAFVTWKTKKPSKIIYTLDAIKVAVIGKPNVGKSSLVNAIAGEELSLIHISCPVASATRRGCLGKSSGSILRSAA